MANDTIKTTKRIVLLGASVGKAWNISELPQRLNSYNYIFENIIEYSFDKTNKLKEILSRKQNRPDAIIIKECAAYFPGDLNEYQKFIKEWVNLCKKDKVVPILATVVPVVKTFPFRTFLISLLLEKKFRFPIHTFDSIIAFNDWIRDYSHKEGLVVLDLEGAMRISLSDRHLNGKFAKKDGLHLKEAAYKELDKIVTPTLNQVKWIN